MLPLPDLLLEKFLAEHVELHFRELAFMGEDVFAGVDELGLMPIAQLECLEKVHRVGNGT